MLIPISYTAKESGLFLDFFMSVYLFGDTAVPLPFITDVTKQPYSWRCYMPVTPALQ